MNLTIIKIKYAVSRLRLRLFFWLARRGWHRLAPIVNGRTNNEVVKLASQTTDAEHQQLITAKGEGKTAVMDRLKSKYQGLTE